MLKIFKNQETNAVVYYVLNITKLLDMKAPLITRYGINLPITRKTFAYHKYIITKLLVLPYRIIANAVQELNSCILQAR